MPTRPPEPIQVPSTEEEARLREQSVTFIRELCEGFQRYSMAVQSHPPTAMRHKEFVLILVDLVEWAEARPDWTLEVINNAINATLQTHP